jgi:hypothetical protein
MKGRIIPHLFLLNFFTMAGFMILAILFESASFDFNVEHGIFGWL